MEAVHILLIPDLSLSNFSLETCLPEMVVLNTLSTIISIYFESDNLTLLTSPYLLHQPSDSGLFFALLYNLQESCCI